MSESWVLSELVDQVGARISALPAPNNGQVRAIPDERTIRYYGTIGLLDRPLLVGRTAHYGPRHLAQVVAIKRLQTMGRSLAEIQKLWPLDDDTLSRMSGVPISATTRTTRSEFWKRSTTAPRSPFPSGSATAAPRTPPAVELRVELSPEITITIAMPQTGIALQPADVRAIRAAAAPLLAELARRRLTPHAEQEAP